MADMDEGFKKIEAGSQLIAEGHALIAQGFKDALDGRTTLKGEIADLRESITELQKLILERR